MRKITWQLVVLLFLYLAISSPTTAQSMEAVVQAVLFYSPTCGHCHYVITEVLTPMVEEYGPQLQILAVNVTEAGGQQLYQAAIKRFEIPEERLGVPMLIAGPVVMVGSREIPETFPGLVEEGLATGGITWPDIPELLAALAAAPQSEPTESVNQPAEQLTVPAPSSEVTDDVAVNDEAVTPVKTVTSTPAAIPTFTAVVTVTTAAEIAAGETQESGPVALVQDVDGQSLASESKAAPADPVGFTLGMAVLIALILSLAYGIWRLIVYRRAAGRLTPLPSGYTGNWAIPILALVGLGVATYLAYVEVSHVEAVCGPVGECNLVQASPYAQILGIPIALLGMASYVAAILLWAAQKYFNARWGNWPTLTLTGLLLFATLFSIYLTLLELFVIKAVCAWCLSSALSTMILMLLVVVPITATPSRPLDKPPTVEGAF